MTGSEDVVGQHSANRPFVVMVGLPGSRQWRYGGNSKNAVGGRMSSKDRLERLVNVGDRVRIIGLSNAFRAFH